jgi:signal transduction histidine kinase
MKKYSDKQLIEELSKRLSESRKVIKEYQDLNVQLKNVNNKLQESEGMKSHFLSNITNEIVNPFCSILGLAKNILSMKEGDLDRIKSMASLIHSEAFDLDFQLKNIFTAARLEAGEAIPSVCNVEVNLLIESVIDNFKYKARQKELIIDFQYEKGEKFKKDSTFKTDPEKLKLIIANLLSNSIKFSNAASKVVIKVWYEEDDLKLSIKDYGIGIRKDDLKRIFDRFEKIDQSINSVRPGHGLGLSVVKSLLDILNGTINITSKFNSGSLFTISIPQASLEAEIGGIATDDNEFFFGEEETF